MFECAERMMEIPKSPVRAVLDKAKAMEKRGCSVIHMEIGEPDFDTPDPVAENAIQGILNHDTHYTANRGEPTLLKAISDNIKRRHGIDYSPEEEIIVTVGAAEALFDVFFAYIGPGDHVVGFAPAFMNYKTDVKMCGGTFTEVPLREEDEYQVDIDALAKAIKPETKAIILCNPCNPSGAVMDEISLQKVADIATEHDLMVICDEIYDRIIYDGISIRSIASLGNMRERCIMINGFSKAYAMTGWRIGYLATHKDLIAPILKIHQYLTTCLPAFTQKSLAKQLNDPACNVLVDEMVRTFQERRDIVTDMLAKNDKVSFVKPQGAFYLLLNVSKTGLSGRDFAEQLLDQYGVAVVPASAFGEAYGDYIRISYANSKENIVEGLNRINAFIDSL